MRLDWQIQEALHRLEREKNVIEKARLIEKLEALERENSELKKKKILSRRLLVGSLGSAAGAIALNAVDGWLLHFVDADENRRKELISVEAKKAEALLKEKKYTAARFWNALGIGFDALVIYGGEYKHYPSANALANKVTIDKRGSPFSDGIVHYGNKVRADFGQEFQRSPESGLWVRRTTDFFYDTGKHRMFLDRARNLAFRHKSIVLVGASKVNAVTYLTTGYQKSLDDRRDFYSPDGSWRASGLFNLVADEGDWKTKYDAFLEQEWASFEWKIRYIRDDGKPDICIPSYVNGDADQQTDCYFLITKLQSPLPAPNDQNVVLITSVHGFGATAAWQMFKSYPLDDVCEEFVRQWIDKAEGRPSWQVIGRASFLDKKASMCRKIDYVAFNKSITSYVV